MPYYFLMVSPRVQVVAILAHAQIPDPVRLLGVLLTDNINMTIT